MIVNYPGKAAGLADEIAVRVYNSSPESGPSYDNYKVKALAEDAKYEYKASIHSSGIIIRRWVAFAKVRKLNNEGEDFEVLYWGYGDHAKHRANDIAKVLIEIQA